MHKDLPPCPEHYIPSISEKCLELGLRLAKIHEVLKFRQTPWLKKYIDFNTDLRKYRDVRRITRWDGRYGARATIAKPNFGSCIIFDKDMIIVKLHLAKTFIYDFHYKYIDTKFGHQAKLLYTDTNSLIYHFTVPNIYECIKQDLDKFDTSDYPPENVYGIPLVDKKVLGLMKNECNGGIIAEFTGLIAKLYSFRMMTEDKDEKRAKGVKGSLLKTISFDDYSKCALEHGNFVEHQSLIQRQKHQVYTIEQKKVALSCNDDNRIVFQNITDTLPWGYKTCSQTEHRYELYL
ncbi:uncharacterized protein LOC124414412 [Diprion similis]|uniref:uncharacterized protein LOC124414412 n=1 Tax=Diprion similis TaxID=362088 RepID=UPI001EF84181|nr:uncharacterized protein LOC124414412 [Diprion similis]